MAEVAECEPIRPALVHTLGRAGVRPEVFARIDWDELNEAIRRSRSPHIAIHLQATTADWDLSPTDEAVMERMVTHVQMAKERLRVPLLLENVHHTGKSGNLEVCVRPERICEALERTGTDLLLDTAHLRCAAFKLGIDAKAYALQLPLHKVREIHVAGPRIVEGMLRDRHMEIQEPDYEILAWLLERTNPQMITLEYGGTGPIFERPGMTDPEALLRQLTRLKGMLPT
jgi:hypothetical protein